VIVSKALRTAENVAREGRSGDWIMLLRVETMFCICRWVGNGAVDVDVGGEREAMEMENARGWRRRGGEGENSVGVCGYAGLIQLISRCGSSSWRVTGLPGCWR
jgi:hypothetical protein